AWCPGFRPNSRTARPDRAPTPPCSARILLQLAYRIVNTRRPPHRVPGRPLATAGWWLEPGRAGTRLIGMMVSRRLTMVVAAIAVPVALTAGCASVTRSTSATSSTSAHPAAATQAHAAPTARFSAKGLSFRYPAAWRSVMPRDGLSDYPGLLVYLSTVRLKGTCVASSSPGRIAETCTYPIRVLPSGGVLVSWNANSLPNWRMPKATTIVAGRAAVESKTRGG